jgi:hypothetical protein
MEHHMVAELDQDENRPLSWDDPPHGHLTSPKGKRGYRLGGIRAAW